MNTSRKISKFLLDVLADKLHCNFEENFFGKKVQLIYQFLSQILPLFYAWVSYDLKKVLFYTHTKSFLKKDYWYNKTLCTS